MRSGRSDGERELWPRWVVANALGLALGLVLWGVISDTLGEHGAIDSRLVVIPAQIVAFLSVGAVAGTLQWLALRSHLDLPRWNILVSSVSFAAGFIAGFALGGPPVDFLLGFLLFALGTAAVQWRALRRRAGRAGWWVPVSVVALAIGGAVGVVVVEPIAEALATVLDADSLVGFALILTTLGTIAGATGGAISGGVLIRLLRQGSRPETTTSVARGAVEQTEF